VADSPTPRRHPRGLRIGPEPKPATIDETAGRYRGVGVGSTKDEATQTLGRIASMPRGPLAPIGSDPVEVGGPPAPDDPRNANISIWRFDNAVMPRAVAGAWLLTVTKKDATTTKGVGVGSTLEDIKTAYPGAECATANEGTEYTQFEYCTTEAATERFLYFAYDPCAA
jgi:hypothetical protein